MSLLPRDSFRSRVYAAERSVSVNGQTFTSVEECQAYYDKLISSAWFKRRWGSIRSVLVKPGHGHRRATCSYSNHPIIQLPRWSRHESTMLHEIAHACTWAEHRWDVAPHGREYIVVLLSLIRRQMGDHAWRSYRQAFLDRKVRVTMPRKPRKLTPAQKKAAVERLAAARAAKRQ